MIAFVSAVSWMAMAIGGFKFQLQLETALRSGGATCLWQQTIPS
jgi:hypothetical protein